MEVAQWESVCLTCERQGFDPRSGQTQIVKTGSDSSNAKRSATRVSVKGPWSR